jgi:hypothetical protein
MMSNDNKSTGFNAPNGFIDYRSTQHVTAKLVTDKNIFQRAKLLKAPKASDVPIF